MYAAIDFAGNETAMRIHRPDLKNQSDVLDDLRAEWTNMLLFCLQRIRSISFEFSFLSRQAPIWRSVQSSMRVDLGRQPIDLETLDLNLTRTNS